MATDIVFLLGLALVSGIITSFSPCLFPLLPTYFSYMNSYKKGNISVKEGITVSFFLTLGILVIFLILALLVKIGFSAISSFLSSHVPELNFILSIFLIILGLLMIFGKEMTIFYRLPGISSLIVSENPENNIIASFSLGLAYTAIAAPCAGSIFLSLAAFFIVLDPISIMLLTVIYAIGCGLPFLFIGLTYPKFGKEIRDNYKSVVSYVKPVSGVILLLLSFYLINDYVIPYYNIQIGSFVFAGFDKELMASVYILLFILGIIILLLGFVYMKMNSKRKKINESISE